jgi:hypothetical protein
MSISAAWGFGLALIGGLGDAIFPTMGRNAYFSKSTGRRVHYHDAGYRDGTPYYSYTEDVQKYGNDVGLIWFVLKYTGKLILTGMIFTIFLMSLCGGYAIYILIRSRWFSHAT